jgi:hypothetical protein
MRGIPLRLNIHGRIIEKPLVTRHQRDVAGACRIGTVAASMQGGGVSGDAAGSDQNQGGTGNQQRVHGIPFPELIDAGVPVWTTRDSRGMPRADRDITESNRFFSEFAAPSCALAA